MATEIAELLINLSINSVGAVAGSTEAQAAIAGVDTAGRKAATGGISAANAAFKDLQAGGNAASSGLGDVTATLSKLSTLSLLPLGGLGSLVGSVSTVGSALGGLTAATLADTEAAAANAAAKVEQAAQNAAVRAAARAVAQGATEEEAATAAATAASNAYSAALERQSAALTAASAAQKGFSAAQASGGATGAEAALGNLSSALGGVDAAASKTTGSLGGLAGGIPPVAVGVASAVVVAAEGVRQFTDLGDALYKFQAVTGATAEQASTLIGVLKELGISEEAVQHSMGMLADHIATGKDGLAQYNVEVAKTASGQVDLVGTLQNIAERYNALTDPTERAQLAQTAFGRGWQSLAPLLEQGSAGIKALAQNVSNAGLVMDQQGVNQAHAFSEQMRQLKMDVEGVLVPIGDALVPVLSILARVLGDVVTPLTKVVDGVEHLTTSVLSHIPVLGHLVGSADQVKQSQADLSAQIDQTTAEMSAETQAAKALTAEQDAMLKAVTELPAAQEALAAATSKVGDVLNGSAKSADDARKAEEALAASADRVTEAGNSLAESKARATEADGKATEAEAAYKAALADTTTQANALANAELNLRQSQLDGQKATEDLAKANEKLRLLRAEGAGGSLITDAELAVQDAQLKSDQSAQKTIENTQKLAAERAGKTHADEVAKAEDTLTRALDSQQSARDTVIRDTNALAQARVTATEKANAAAAAEGTVTDAIDRVIKAADSEADAVAHSQGRAAATVQEKAQAELDALSNVEAAFPQVAPLIENVVNQIAALPGILVMFNGQLVGDPSVLAGGLEGVNPPGTGAPAGLGAQAAAAMAAFAATLPHAAKGAVVKARPGGTPVIAGEAGVDEAIVPLGGASEQVAAALSGAGVSGSPHGSVVVNDHRIVNNIESINLSVPSWQDFVIEAARDANLATF